MWSLKRVMYVLMIAVLVLALPTGAFAKDSGNSIKEGTYPKHVRIPITLVPTEDGKSSNNSISPLAAKPIDGYLDFWSVVHGSTVDANWTVTITTPNTYITRVNLTLKWGLGLLGTTVPFNYQTFGTPKSVSNQSSYTYSSTGTKWATISGSVSTLSTTGSSGTAFTVSPATIEFYVK
ncbi:hypothetical protein [Paenibacillus hexagrammi]|uniref:Uncharacterized protein n=1 Tax=Paenibacillus hexagrammi TaxID=2908839 RepID=A0ABY3SNA9_9BACL|nr:hypothetical protein [Paenibacillus sp. YPD9-1]UJF35543.1 hypothetical protein L0M14_10840 [Paenibacillus sp. YPD9-1]